MYINSENTDIPDTLIELCIAIAYNPIDDLEKFFNKYVLSLKYENGDYKLLNTVVDELGKNF